MIVYSHKIIRFIDEIKTTIKQVLTKEIGVKVSGNRFFDYEKKASYPIKVVIFNHKKMLGYFDPSFYELGFHECLIWSSQSQLHSVIRHELAHYIVSIVHGSWVQPHGPEFRAFCEKLGWREDVYQATVCLDGPDDSAAKENSILRKIQKLMSLATSHNSFEAEQAMLKSQQLLLKHNIECAHIDEEGEKIYLKRILKQKKENSKMRSIALILETFLVNCVYVRTEDFIYLEILGNATHIEIAEYVANVLQLEFEKLWDRAKRELNLKGMIAKNSFFMGLAKGYCQKVQALKRNYQRDSQNALMVIEKKLGEAKEMVYQRLSVSKSCGRYCRDSAQVGEQMGRNLHIKPAVQKQSKTTHLLGFNV